MKTINHQLKFLVVIIFVTLNGFAFGQSNLVKAKEMMASYQYQKAIELFNAHFNTNPPLADDARLLAECYMEVNDTKAATVWMGKVVALGNAKPADIKIYGTLLKSEGKYPEAIAQFEQYKTLVPAESEKANQWINACKNAEKWIAKPEFWEVTNAEMFNTPNSEFGLIPFQKGYALTSDRKIDGVKYKPEELYGWTGNPYLKMFYVTLDANNQSITNLVAMDDLNYTYHNGPGTYNPDRQMMFYTRTKMVKVTKKPINTDPTSWYDHSTAGDYTNRLEIYSAKLNGNGWNDIKAFAFNNADEYSVGHPALSPDGLILYFVSNMPGGFGGSDIYYCEKIDANTWTAPKNAGNIINSEGDEVFPFVDSKGTLYFSSNGLPGMGGLDLFSAKGSKNTWSIPENLKFPLNSPKDDFSIYFTEAGKSGFLASNREGGKGMDDIYRFVITPPTNLILSVVTKEKLDNGSLAVLTGVDVDIKNKTTNDIQKMPVNSKGQLYTKVDCNTSYEITGTKDGYFTQLKNITTNCITRNDTVFVELTFDKIIIDKPIVIKNIYYDFDKSFIRPDAAVELDKIVVILMQNPGIEIELGSHTDCRGSDEYNLALSQRRADAAIAYIISNGISKNRITAKGYGETKLVNKCSNGVECTEEEHQMNRRTEFKVTKMVIKGRETELKSIP